MLIVTDYGEIEKRILAGYSNSSTKAIVVDTISQGHLSFSIGGRQASSEQALNYMVQSQYYERVMNELSALDLPDEKLYTSSGRSREAIERERWNYYLRSFQNGHWKFPPRGK